MKKFWKNLKYLTKIEKICRIFKKILINCKVNFDEILVESEDSYDNFEKMGKNLKIFRVLKNIEENSEKSEESYENLKRREYIKIFEKFC